MSHHANSWAIEQTPRTPDGKLDPQGKLVLLVLADLAGNDGVLWHGSKSIAELACIPPDGARKVCGRLEKAGLLVRIDRTRGDGSQTSSITVLAPHGNRGAMRDPRENKDHGSLIAAALAPAHTPVSSEHGGVASGHGAGSGEHGGSEPVSEPVSEEREHAGANALDGIEENASGRFRSAWMFDKPKVLAALAAEQANVAALVVAKLVDAAPRWEARSVAFYVESSLIPEARKMAERNASPGPHLFGGKSVRSALADRDADRLRRIRGEAA